MDTRHKDTHTLRIVVTDEEPSVLESLRIMLLWESGNEVLTFGDSRAAMRELERQAPDLFTMGLNHRELSGREMLARLAQRKVKFPVLVISAGVGMWTEETIRSWAPGLKVSALAKPFLLETLRDAVAAALRMG